ncbi:MAG TPA: flagellar biosynthesis protein FlhF [Symbiobacteriaceae bacterium]|jgi:flagellar biosynthesis protein FlhF|nr:flagellar biosynthesis protein FlhF [Symbiobacteriaceae bacterium]
MRVKKFVARSLPEAMVQVKAELGPEAVILHTNELKVGGIFGLFGQRMIQVMAAVEAKSPAEKPVPPALAAARTAAPALAAAQVAVPAPAPAVSESRERVAPPPEEKAAGPDIAAVREEMADMRAMMSQIVARMDQPAGSKPMEPQLKELMAALKRGGVDEEVATPLLARVRSRITKAGGDWGQALELTRTLMVKDLGGVQTVSPKGRVVALVGPTGVGKTTTLAKLAAHLALGQGRRVALITADTYRIAAVEQLRTYSEIIGVPLEVVYDPAEVRGALAAHSDKDLILVDTAGRSPKNHAHMSELKAYLDVLEPSETYLVLSLTSGYRDATMIVDHYLPMGFDHFLFTKWDEAAAPGLIYNIVHRYKRPLSYVTTGQNVPDDMEIANPETITRAILGV